MNGPSFNLRRSTFEHCSNPVGAINRVTFEIVMDENPVHNGSTGTN